MIERRRARVLVSGRVQGVAFRDATRRMAEHTGVCGWVRNLDDGRVEALFEGPPERVAEAVAWCHHGPPSARVDGVSVAEDPDGGGPLAGFAVRATAHAPGS